MTVVHLRALLLVMACLCPAASAADPPAPSWFVPPPAKPGIAGAGRGVDMRRASETDITVTAQRRPVQRDPHGEETHDFQPAHSEAASPAQGKIGQSYCGSAYQTIAGQPATGMDVVSMGGGRC